MSRIAVDPSALGALATRIEREIHSRGLVSGDRFLSTDQVGELLGVSSATAHRALNLLTQRKLLVRRHGHGTFIGPNVRQTRRLSLNTVFILLPESQRDVASVELDALVAALHAHLGSVSVQLSLLPAEDPVEFVRELLQSTQHATRVAGVIPISCPREVYRYLSEFGAPTVVLGSLYRDQQHLPSVDIDHHAAGRLLAEYLLREGHNRLALLATGGGRPGDDAFYDGVSEALTAARLPHNALTVRIFPHDFDAFRSQVEELIARAERPTGIICRSAHLVGMVRSAVAAAGLVSPKDVDIVFQTQSAKDSNRTSYAHVHPKDSFKQIAQRIAVTLHALRERQDLATHQLLIPVELHEPGESENGGES